MPYAVFFVLYGCLCVAGSDLILVFIAMHCLLYIIAYEHILFTINALFSVLFSLRFIIFFLLSFFLTTYYYNFSQFAQAKKRFFMSICTHRTLYCFGLVLLKKEKKVTCRHTTHTHIYEYEYSSIRRGLWSCNDFSLLENEWIYICMPHIWWLFFSILVLRLFSSSLTSRARFGYAVVTLPWIMWCSSF